MLSSSIRLTVGSDPRHPWGTLDTAPSRPTYRRYKLVLSRSPYEPHSQIASDLPTPLFPIY